MSPDPLAVAQATARQIIDHLAAPAADAEALAAAIFIEAGREPALHLAQMLRGAPEYGELPLGLKLKEFVLGARECAFGPSHLAVAAILQEIAQSLVEMGEPHGAAQRFQQVLAICQSEAGPEDSMTIVALLDLGLIKREIADFDEAATLTSRALALLQARGDAPSEILRALGGLAMLETERGYPDQARHWAEEQLEASRRCLGEAHPATAFSMIELGPIRLSPG